MKILVIEDELQMLENIQQNLEKEKYLVETAQTCEEAQQKIGVYKKKKSSFLAFLGLGRPWNRSGMQF